MEFITLPPEVTSALIHAGPGAESLIEASAAWQRLGVNLEDSAGSYTSAVSSLTESWHGPSSSAMDEAFQPFLSWLRTTAQQAQQLSSSTKTAAAAFASTLASVVHPSVVTANRVQLSHLLATNGFGKNLPAIAQVESEYQNIWENNSGALSRYLTSTEQALKLDKFTSPPSVTNATGLASQTSAVTNAAATPTASSLASQVQSALTSLAAGDGINLGIMDPTTGYIGEVNQYINQFISSGFPINLLSYAAQSSSAQALQSVAPEIGAGLSEGESALGESAAGLSSAIRALGAAQTPTAMLGAGVTIGNLTAPPAVVGLLPATTQVPVQLASQVTPLDAGDEGWGSFMPPLMPPPVSAGSGWRKRKEQKYEDLELGKEIKGTVMRPPPSAG